MTTFAPASLILEAIASDENPANMTEWIAPTLAVANMHATAMGVTGKYNATTSPFLTPASFKQFATFKKIDKQSVQIYLHMYTMCLFMVFKQ